MTAPIDLDTLESLLFSRAEIDHVRLDVLETGEVTGEGTATSILLQAMPLVESAPALIAEVRRLRAALHEACDAADDLGLARRGDAKGGASFHQHRYSNDVDEWRTLAGPRRSDA